MTLLDQLDLMDFRKEHFPEGVPPRRQAFADARSFIRELPERMKLQPVLKLMPNGEIRFTWSADGPPEIYVQIAFHGLSNGGSYLATKDGWINYCCAAFSPDEGLPGHLYDYVGARP